MALRCGPGRAVEWHCVGVDLGFPGMTSGRVVCFQGKVLKPPKESVKDKPRGRHPASNSRLRLNIRNLPSSCALAYVSPVSYIAQLPVRLGCKSCPSGGWCCTAGSVDYTVLWYKL